MTNLFLCLSCASFVITVLLSTQPALADNSRRFSKDELQQTTWFKARREYRVEDNTPIVHYPTPKEPEPIYLIPTGLPKAKPAPVVVLPGPGQAGGAGGGIVAPPGYAFVDPSQPAPARFGSNIPATGLSPAKALPNGSTTNRLAGRLWGAPKSSGETVAIPARILPAGDSLAKTAIYPTTGTSSSSSVNTAVKGDLLRK